MRPIEFIFLSRMPIGKLIAQMTDGRQRTKYAKRDRQPDQMAHVSRSVC